MKGMVLTMKIFAIDLTFNSGRTENAVYACAAYDETISIPEKAVQRLWFLATQKVMQSEAF